MSACGLVAVGIYSTYSTVHLLHVLNNKSCALEDNEGLVHPNYKKIIF